MRFFPLKVHVTENVVHAEKILMLNFRLLEGLPNTYLFAKNLAEQVVESYSKAIPLCIVRPAIGKRTTYEPHERIFKFLYPHIY